MLSFQLREANLLDAVKVAGNQFRNDKNVESLVKNLSDIFLPNHHKLFKGIVLYFFKFNYDSDRKLDTLTPRPGVSILISR